MQLKNDNNTSYNAANNPPFNGAPDNSYNRFGSSYTPPSMPNRTTIDPDDDYRDNNVNVFERSMKVNAGSRNIVFNMRSLTIIAFLALYVIFLIFIYSQLHSSFGGSDNSPKLAEGYVKTLDSSMQRVTSGGGGVTVVSTEKVYTATYQFEVDGKQYTGTYDSLDKIEINSKVSVIYDSSNPSDNHRQTAEESVKPKTSKKSAVWLAFFIIAAIGAVIFYGTYLRIRILLNFKF